MSLHDGDRERFEAVRAAKAEKARRGRGIYLSNAELDRILPPVDCRRTRDRLARGGEAERIDAR